LNTIEQQHAGLVLYLRSILFWLGFATFTLFFATLLVLSFPFPLEKRFALTHGWSTATIRWLRITCNLRHEVQGVENIPDTAGIIFAKHQSTWETLILNFWFEKQSWVIKRELMWVPIFGWGMYMMNPIALNRGAGKKAIDQLVDQGRERLAKGNWIVIFPEGTRTAPGTKGRYRIGGAILAERTGASITPIAHNAGEYWPRRSFIKRPGVIKICIGPSIETNNKSAHEILAEAEQWIESEMARITTLKAVRE
jgi:1-acyl-sn-glycerol-3-phosphate acyltransferase